MSTEDAGEVLGRLALARVVPVVEITDAALAVPLAGALRDAGLPVLEVTLRTPAGLDAIRAIRAEFPDFTVGAGTLVTPAMVQDAADAGALFGVAPGFSPALSNAATDAGLPFIPGAVTATEILSAVEAGHRFLKFFPAEQSGGVAAIAAFSAPFASLNLRFMPTGGIRPAGLAAYLAEPSVFAVGGTWIASRAAISEGRFAEIEAAARAVVEAVVVSGRTRQPATAEQER